MNFINLLASAPEAQGGIVEALGIDWRLLIIQIVAFLVLVAVLGKFVYPWLMKQVDERQENIEAAAKAATKAQAAAADSQQETAKLLAEARKEASGIIATAKLEASELRADMEAKAKATAERIVSDAQVQLQKDIEVAKRDLHNETLELIALATEKVTAGALSGATDQEVIAAALKEAIR